MNPIKITLTGDPVSANQMWRSAISKNGKAFTYMPVGAKTMKKFWQFTAKAQLQKQGRKITSEELAVSIGFYFKDRLRRDIDNFIKVALDSMTGVVYEDDKQIRTLYAEKLYDPTNPRIEILISNLNLNK